MPHYFALCFCLDKQERLYLHSCLRLCRYENCMREKRQTLEGLAGVCCTITRVLSLPNLFFCWPGLVEVLGINYILWKWPWVKLLFYISKILRFMADTFWGHSKPISATPGIGWHAQGRSYVSFYMYWGKDIVILMKIFVGTLRAVVILKWRLKSCYKL